MYCSLVTTVATLVATVGLYVVIPKGFLPLQDTGLITAVTGGRPGCLVRRDARLQEQIAAAIRARPGRRAASCR